MKIILEHEFGTFYVEGTFTVSGSLPSHITILGDKFNIVTDDIQNFEYPSWCCSECGLEANRLTCLKKYGKEPKVKSFSVSTYHDATCGVCGKYTSVTEPRDFFYPDFGLLTSIWQENIKKATRND